MITKISLSSLLSCVFLSLPAYAEIPAFYKNPLVIDSSNPIFDDSHNYQNQLERQQIKSQEIIAPEELKLVKIETEELEIVQEEPEQQQAQDWDYPQPDWRSQQDLYQQNWYQREQQEKLEELQEDFQQSQERQQEQFEQFQQQLQQNQPNLPFQEFQQIPQLPQNRPNLPFSN
jgi:hypothetical protein